MGQAEIINKMKEILSKKINMDEKALAAVNADSRLVNDIGFDSVTLLEFVVMVEREFGIFVEDEYLTNGSIHTIGGLSNYVGEKLAAAAR